MVFVCARFRVSSLVSLFYGFTMRGEGTLASPASLPALLTKLRNKRYVPGGLMIFDNRIRELPGSVRPRPVGTRGGVGWMRGPCACPRGNALRLGSVRHDGRTATRTSTRPPPVPTSAPCPYRPEGGVSSDFPLRLSKIIRTERHPLPVLVDIIHQAHRYFSVTFLNYTIYYTLRERPAVVG